MSKVPIAIVTDSTAGLPADLAARYGIYVIPQNVIFGETVFRDGVNLGVAEFFERLAQSPELPTTSQPSAGDFFAVYRELSEKAEAILSIHISCLLSGTYQSAIQAKEMLPEVPIYVVDSRSASMGLGLLVLEAARMAQAGTPVQQIVAHLEELIPQLRVIFVVDTLKYLQKGGRIGGAQALLGSMLSVKPLLHLEKGRVEPLEKVRTRAKALERLQNLAMTYLNEGQSHVAIIHGQSPEDANRLYEKIRQHPHCTDVVMTDVSPVIGVHTGPGVVGFALYPDGRAA